MFPLLFVQLEKVKVNEMDPTQFLQMEVERSNSEIEGERIKARIRDIHKVRESSYQLVTCTNTFNRIFSDSLQCLTVLARVILGIVSKCSKMAGIVSQEGNGFNYSYMPFLREGCLREKLSKDIGVTYKSEYGRFEEC